MISESAAGNAAAIPDRKNSDAVTAGLGEGAAGRALFFVELFSATSDSLFLRSARVSAKTAMDLYEPNLGYGLYRGLSGVAAAASEVAEVTGDELLRELSLEAFIRIAEDSLNWGSVNDVLTGRAGVGLALLYAWEHFQDEVFLSAATELGDHLLGLAETTEGNGLRWMRGQSMDFDLPNFSHGTAGIGYYFARLGEVSDEPRFVDAAIRASNYLDLISDQRNGLYLVPYGIPNEGFVTPFDIGWAHGPAGTGRFQYLMWSLNEQSTSEAKVRASAHTLMASGMPGSSSDSTKWVGPFTIDRRFGTSGAASFLIDWGLASNDPSVVSFAGSVVDDILNQANQIDDYLFWETPLYGFQTGEGKAVFTGYFYGAAGFGMLLLQYHHALNGKVLRTRLPDDPFPTSSEW